MIDKNFVLAIRDKVTGKIDQDWSEICEAYGIDANVDTVRKAGVGVRWADSVGLLKDETENEKQPVVADAAAIRIEKQKFFDQRREYNKLLVTQAREEELAKGLTDAANRLAEKKPFILSSRPWCDFTTALPENEAVVVLSDWHYGSKSNNLFNAYNTGICAKRVGKLIREIETLCKDKNMRAIHVVILGDMIEGCLRATNRIASTELACEQVMDVSEMLAETIFELSNFAKKIYVHSTWGNHGRMVQDKKDSIHADNVERIIPWWLKQRFANTEKIEICEEDNTHELILFNCCGDNICATHGDLDKDGSGIMRLKMAIETSLGFHADRMIFGHTHEFKAGDLVDCNIYRNGSLCGTDEYAKNGRLFSPPSQLFFMFRDGHGLESVSEITL